MRHPSDRRDPPVAPAPFSVVVPVHNEASLLDEVASRMVTEFRRFGHPFELVICENGSTDGSAAILNELARRYPEVVVDRWPIADYGLALGRGIALCQHDFVIIYNIDFWSASFAQEALAQLETRDLVVGSKVLREALDQRPFVRRFITRGFNTFLRRAFGFLGTDTHGMKALRRQPILPVVDACVTHGCLLDTELVLRVQRAGLRSCEIPVATIEIRQPSYWSVVKRVLPVLLQLLTLWRALQQVPDRGEISEPVRRRAEQG